MTNLPDCVLDCVTYRIKTMSRQQPPEKARIDYMARRVPVNPRYAGVRAVTDTGASLSRHVDKINEIKTNFKYRKDEFFKRMKISTLVQVGSRMRGGKLCGLYWLTRKLTVGT